MVEVQTDSITLTYTGEKFRFFNYGEKSLYSGDGIFTTTGGKEEVFIGSLKGNTFNILPGGITSDTSLVLNKYNSYMQSVKECTRNKVVFNPCNPICITLKKD